MGGDSKRRGTFEERKAAAIARQKVEEELELARKKEIEVSKTPEQKIKEHQAMMTLMTILGMTGMYYLPSKHR